MSHQPSHLGKLLGLLINRLTQFRNRRVQPIQQLQQNAVVAGSPRGLSETTPVALVHAVATTSFCTGGLAGFDVVSDNSWLAVLVSDELVFEDGGVLSREEI